MTGTEIDSSRLNPPPPPSSNNKNNTPYYYFAYGSNLSPSQMRQRCTSSPISSIPIAIARLPRWRFLICERGYANVMPSPRGHSHVTFNDDGEKDSDDVVYGILYHMMPSDELILDGYEGIDYTTHYLFSMNVTRPHDQGDGNYNKHYIPVTIEKWLTAPALAVPATANVAAARAAPLIDGYEKRNEIKGEQVPALVYVDEERMEKGKPRDEYVGRMNRGIRESAKLGLPEWYVKRVMRRFIPEE